MTGIKRRGRASNNTVFTRRRLDSIIAGGRSSPVAIDRRSRLVFLSDCHRGGGGWADDFSHNRVIYLHAVQYYLERGFTLVSAGDDEELWENEFTDIHWAYGDVYSRLGSFHSLGRLIVIWGNHNNAWRNPRTFRSAFLPAMWRRFDGRPHPLLEGMDPSELDSVIEGRILPPSHPIFNPLEAKEGVLLRHEPTGIEILAVHGHQGDFWSDSAWRFSRFMVHSFWRRFQLAGLRARNTPAGNYALRSKVEGRLMRWAREEGIVLVSGHTHQPVFPEPGSTPYFNCGSCIHPRCITGIELCDDTLMLIKWDITTTGADGGDSGENLVHLKRTVLQGPEPLKDYASSARGPKRQERSANP